MPKNENDTKSKHFFFGLFFLSLNNFDYLTIKMHFFREKKLLNLVRETDKKSKL